MKTVHRSLTHDIQVWEGEGGAASLPPIVGALMSGTPAQVEWAERIKCQVAAEFDRVSSVLRSVASRQRDAKRADIEAILAILEEKRVEVLSKEQAGYFIRDWQEISDQVRQMIGQDSRYQAIKAKKAIQR